MGRNEGSVTGIKKYYFRDRIEELLPGARLENYYEDRKSPTVADDYVEFVISNANFVEYSKLAQMARILRTDDILVIGNPVGDDTAIHISAKSVVFPPSAARVEPNE